MLLGQTYLLKALPDLLLVCCVSAQTKCHTCAAFKCMSIMQDFPTLLLKLQQYTHTNGNTVSLLMAEGTLPMYYQVLFASSAWPAPGMDMRTASTDGGKHALDSPAGHWLILVDNGALSGCIILEHADRLQGARPGRCCDMWEQRACGHSIAARRRA